MSAETPAYSQAHTSTAGTKYGVGKPQILRDPGPVAFTDHAAAQYRDRIKDERSYPVAGPRTAWQKGEWIEHPNVCRSNDQPPLEAVRVCKSRQGWGVAFLVVEDPHHERHPDYVPRVVCTVNSFEGFFNGRTRAYLKAGWPHADLGGGSA